MINYIMIIDGISEETKKILRDKVLMRLLPSIMIINKIEKKSLIERLGFTSIRMDYKRASPYYGVNRARTYLVGAYSRRTNNKMTNEEESYIMNTSFKDITDDYLLGKMNFK